MPANTHSYCAFTAPAIETARGERLSLLAEVCPGLLFRTGSRPPLLSLGLLTRKDWALRFQHWLVARKRRSAAKKAHNRLLEALLHKIIPAKPGRTALQYTYLPQRPIRAHSVRLRAIPDKMPTVDMDARADTHSI